MKKTSIYLDEDLDRALAAKAAEEGVSKAEFIRQNLEVVARREKRPRLSVGQLKRLPGYTPHPDGLDAELADALDREDRAIRADYRRRVGDEAA